MRHEFDILGPLLTPVEGAELSIEGLGTAGAAAQAGRYFVEFPGKPGPSGQVTVSHSDFEDLTLPVGDLLRTTQLRLGVRGSVYIMRGGHWFPFRVDPALAGVLRSDAVLDQTALPHAGFVQEAKPGAEPGLDYVENYDHRPITGADLARLRALEGIEAAGPVLEAAPGIVAIVGHHLTAQIETGGALEGLDALYSELGLVPVAGFAFAPGLTMLAAPPDTNLSGMQDLAARLRASPMIRGAEIEIFEPIPPRGLQRGG